MPLFAMVKAELLLLQHKRTNETRELPDFGVFFNLFAFPAEVVHPLYLALLSNYQHLKNPTFLRTES